MLSHQEERSDENSPPYEGGAGGGKACLVVSVASADSSRSEHPSRAKESLRGNLADVPNPPCPPFVRGGALVASLLWWAIACAAILTTGFTSTAHAQQVPTDPTSTHIFPAGGRRGTVVSVRVG